MRSDIVKSSNFCCIAIWSIDDGVSVACCTYTLGVSACGGECVIIFSELTLGDDFTFCCTW